MPAQTLETAAFVLLKRPAAEGWQAFTLFSPRDGLLQAMQRPPRSGGASPRGSLDLFDEADLLLESSNQGRTWFVREARVTARHPGAGRGYEFLRAASSLARLVARNGVSEESRAPVSELLKSAFAAFDEGARPDVVRFKSFYRFARDEGYPVKQAWLPMLPDVERQAALAILGRPLSEQSAEAESVERLQRSLESYLRENTDILVD